MSDDLHSLIVDLESAGARFDAEARGVVQEHSRALRDEARRLAPRTRLPHYARSITYETRSGRGFVEGRIGPVKGGQGSLGHLFEYGSSRTVPKPHMGPALDKIGPDFESDIAELGDPW